MSIKNVEDIKVGDTIFNGNKVYKITNEFIYIIPTMPYGTRRYTKREVQEHIDFMQSHGLDLNGKKII